MTETKTDDLPVRQITWLFQHRAKKVAYWAAYIDTYMKNPSGRYDGDKVRNKYAPKLAHAQGKLAMTVKYKKIKGF